MSSVRLFRVFDRKFSSFTFDTDPSNVPLGDRISETVSICCRFPLPTHLLLVTVSQCVCPAASYSILS
jgi:hypothetical protein